MRRRLWTDDELRDLLLAIGTAGSNQMAALPTLTEQQALDMANYARGYRASLVAMAQALGMQVCQERPTVQVAHVEVVQ